MKYALLLISLVIYFSAIAQKAKIDDDIAYIDGMEYVRWESKMLGNEISVKSLTDNEELIFLSSQQYNDQTQATASNPQGRVAYYEVVFVPLNKKCEITSNFPKALLKLIYNNSLIKDNKLDEAKVDAFILKYGTKFSDRRKSSSSPVNIIINN